MTKITSELVIKLTEDATKKAPAIAAAIEKMQSQAKALQKALAASGTSDRLQSSLMKLGASEPHVEGVARAMRDYANAEGLAASAADWTKTQAANYRAMEDVAIKAVRAIKKEEAGLAYARHEQTERAEADVAALNRATRAAHQRDEAIRRGGFGHYVATGAAAAVSAHGVMRVTEGTVEAGAELQHVITGLKNSGRTVDEIAAIMARAGDVMKSVPTSSLKENLETILETTGAFGNLEHAMENLEFVQKATSVLKAAGDGEASTKSVAYDFAKFAEIRGSAGDSKRLQAESNEMTRGMVFTGGKFNPAEAFKFAQQTSSILSGYSIHFLSRILPSLATEAGGERTGTRANAFANVILGKARDKKQTEEWERLGLLDPKQVIRGNAGAQGWKAGAVKETNLALSDPDVFAEKILIPAMKGHGVNVDDPFAVKKELNQLFRNGESNRFATAIVDVLQRQRLHKDDENIGKAGDVDTIYKRNLTEDPTVAFGALKASLQSLMSVASQPAMSAAASGLSTLAGGIQRLSDVAKDHPGVTVATAATASAAGLGASGALAYKMLNGFGLGSSATALTGSAGFLDGSAAFLKEAAVKLGAIASLAKAEAAAGGVVSAETAAGGVAAGTKTAGRVGTVLKSIPLVGTAVVVGMEAAGAISDYDKNHPEQFKAHTDAIDKWKDTLSPSHPAVGRHIEMNGGMHWVDGQTAPAAPIVDKPAITASNPIAPKVSRPDNASASPEEDFASSEEDNAAPIAGKRAGGGPVSRGNTYLVGEHGPELFTAGMNGAISTADVQRLLSRDRMASAMIRPSQTAATDPRAIVASVNDMHRDVVSGLVRVAEEVGHLRNRTVATFRTGASTLSLTERHRGLDTHGQDDGLAFLHRSKATRVADVDLSRAPGRSGSPVREPEDDPTSPEASPIASKRADDDPATGGRVRDARAIVASIKDMHQDTVSGFIRVAEETGHAGSRIVDALRRQPSMPSAGALPPIAGKRALGGPVSAGKTYLVGEHGPELFSPGLSGAISTHDVQRLLSRGSFATRAASGDPDTAKAIRAMAFELAGAVDGVARAVDRLDAKNTATYVGADGYDGGGGVGGVAHGGGGGGRRGFMGRMPDGRYGGRRGVDGKPDGAPVTKDRSAFAGDYKTTRRSGITSWPPPRRAASIRQWR